MSYHASALLNPMLFSRLQGRFGRVKVTNSGAPNEERIEFDSLTDRSRLKVSSFGETYHVNCAFCRDTRQRMSVNHTYGTTGPGQGGEVRTFLWRCYNEECQQNFENRKQLADWLVWSNGRDQQMTVSEGIAVPARALSASNLPGRCVHARHLGSDHPMVTYFRQRRQGPVLHSTLVQYDIHYCMDAPIRSVVGRAVIPFYFNNTLVGWQARYLGDLDWKASGIQKYYNLPGFSKTLMLYEYDRAVSQPGRPYVVVVEGVTSAWAVGPHAVALFGKTMSAKQQNLLLTDWAGKPIFVYLDGSAEAESRKVVESLRASHNGPVINVRLPASMDPGNLDPMANMGQIRSAARMEGVLI